MIQNAIIKQNRSMLYFVVLIASDRRATLAWLIQKIMNELIFNLPVGKEMLTEYQNILDQYIVGLGRSSNMAEIVLKTTYKSCENSYHLLNQTR